MAFLVSPGVEVKEIDLTNVVPAVSSSIGGISGQFAWGPVEEVVTVGTEKELVAVYGKPDDTTYKYFMPAAQFLQYANNLKVVRAATTGMFNATSGVEGKLIKNSAEFSDSSFVVGMEVVAKYPGVLGNAIDVIAVTNSAGFTNSDFTTPGYDKLFNAAPDTSTWAAARGISNDEIHVVVVDRTGEWTGTSGTVLEIFSGLSVNTAAKRDDGTTNYFADYINAASKYIWIGNPTGFDPTQKRIASVTLNSKGSYTTRPTVTFSLPTESGGVRATGTVTSEILSVALSGTMTGYVAGDKLFFGNAVLTVDTVTSPAGSITAVTYTDRGSFTTLASGAQTPTTNSVAGTGAIITVTYRAKEVVLTEQGSGYVQASTSVTFTQSVTGDAVLQDAGTAKFSLAFGSDGTSVTLGQLETAYGLFADSDTIDVNLLIGTEVSSIDSVTFANKLIAIADLRRDAIAFVSPHISATVNNQASAQSVKTWADAVTSSSYGVMDSTALYVYDKYNDKYRWIIASGAVAGLCAYTDNVSDPWFSPAGFTRGQLRGVTKLAYNPKKADRDTLYKARVNPIVAFPGEGIVLYGDKTAQVKASAFDRINVRRLFIVLEKAVATAAKFSLFELNDEFTRAQFRNLVEPFLRDVQGRRGVTDFFVVCDDTNNTGEVIDSNRFVADIYIKPTRSINFITLNFIATRTGVEFSEIVGTGQ